MCYAVNAVIIAESEDNLQKILYTFFLSDNKFNMEISVVQKKKQNIDHSTRTESMQTKRQ